MPIDITIPIGSTVVFAADIHIKAAWGAKLDDVRGDAAAGLDAILAVVKAEAGKLLILGGDIFDRNIIREAELITMFQVFVERVVATGCQVAAFPGNHDRVFSVTGAPVKQWYEVAPAVININNHVFTYGGRTGFALGFCDVPADAMAAMTEIPASVDSVFLHQNIRGVGLPTYNFDEDLVPSTVDEIYIGDIHQPIAGTTKHGAVWAYPGPMFPQEFGEAHCGVLVFPASKPTRGAASWRRVGLPCRPTKVVDATLLTNTDDLLVERIIEDVVRWASVHIAAGTLQPLVEIRLLSSARQHVARLKAGITAGAAVRVSTTYVQLKTTEVPGAKKITTQGVPPPDHLIDPYFATLKGADGRYISLKRPLDALSLLKALFELKPGDETVKGRENAYRAVTKSHLDVLP